MFSTKTRGSQATSGRTRSSVPLKCSHWSFAEKWREIKAKKTQKRAGISDMAVKTQVTALQTAFSVPT